MTTQQRIERIKAEAAELENATSDVRQFRKAKLFDQLLSALTAEETEKPLEIQSGVIYERAEDMSAIGKLQVMVQEDGDIVVGIFGNDSVGKTHWVNVEFCTVGAGGGRSPETRKALRDLIRAIQADNESNPTD